jgi:hypothetical protein
MSCLWTSQGEIVCSRRENFEDYRVEHFNQPQAVSVRLTAVNGNYQPFVPVRNAESFTMSKDDYMKIVGNASKPNAQFIIQGAMNAGLTITKTESIKSPAGKDEMKIIVSPKTATLTAGSSISMIFTNSQQGAANKVQQASPPPAANKVQQASPPPAPANIINVMLLNLSGQDTIDTRSSIMFVHDQETQKFQGKMTLRINDGEQCNMQGIPRPLRNDPSIIQIMLDRCVPMRIGTMNKIQLM